MNITDITDESDYIESIGKKAAAEAINRAKVDVAEQDKMGAIGEAEANREREIRVAESSRQGRKGKEDGGGRPACVRAVAGSRGGSGENVANAEIATTNAELAVEQATAEQRGEVARRQAWSKIQKAHYMAEQERLSA